MGVKAEEIMIRNWFRHKPVWSYRNELCKELDFQWEDGDWDMVGESLMSLDSIGPISLTEERLERLGAVKRFESEWQYHLAVGGIKIYFRFNKEWYSAIEDIYLGSRIQHVHTLQNLVFALSGRELQMKNP